MHQDIIGETENFLGKVVVGREGGGQVFNAKRFGLLQPYFGQLSCIPLVCMTHEVQARMLTI